LSLVAFVNIPEKRAFVRVMFSSELSEVFVRCAAVLGQMRPISVFLVSNAIKTMMLLGFERLGSYALYDARRSQQRCS